MSWCANLTEVINLEGTFEEITGFKGNSGLF